MALYVSSHYKNSPNDLQLLSDAPAHQLFVLLGPVSDHTSSIPQVLCVLQVCLEGDIGKTAVMSSLARGKRSAGDLIPWTLSQQVCGWLADHLSLLHFVSVVSLQITSLPLFLDVVLCA